MAHSILVAAYYNLSEEEQHEELGGDYFIRREDQERLTRRLVPSARTPRPASYAGTRNRGGEVSGYF